MELKHGPSVATLGVSPILNSQTNNSSPLPPRVVVCVICPPGRCLPPRATNPPTYKPTHTDDGHQVRPSGGAVLELFPPAHRRLMGAKFRAALSSRGDRGAGRRAGKPVRRPFRHLRGQATRR